MLKTIFSTNIENEWNDNMVDILQHNNVQESLHNKSVLLNKEKYNTIRNFFIEFISTKKYYEINTWRIVQLSKLLDMIGIKNYIINEDSWPDALYRPDNLIEMDLGGILGYIRKNKQTITCETFYKISDEHPGYTGHISISEFIINRIESENINIHNA
jgi:hypothetical protein